MNSGICIQNLHSFYLFIYLFIYLLIYLSSGCVGSSFLCEGSLQLRQAGTTLHRGAWASHYRGLSCCGAQAPDAQAQQLWLTGLVDLRHVGSSQTRARTRVPCIGRQILNHCATREAQNLHSLPWILHSLPLSNCLVEKPAISVSAKRLFFEEPNNLPVYHKDFV